MQTAGSELYQMENKMYTYLAGDFLCSWDIFKALLKFVKSTPDVTDFIIHYIWVHAIHRAIHPLSVRQNNTHILHSIFTQVSHTAAFKPPIHKLGNCGDATGP